MKKLIFVVVAFCALCACTNTHAEARLPIEKGMPNFTKEVRETLFSVEVENAIDVMYAASCDYLTQLYGEEVNYYPYATDELKLFIIRKADLEDSEGDVIPEVPEYDIIYDILWPAGYPEE